MVKTVMEAGAPCIRLSLLCNKLLLMWWLKIAAIYYPTVPEGPRSGNGVAQGDLCFGSPKVTI